MKNLLVLISSKFKFNIFSISERIKDPSKSIPYYPLPSNEGYEKFLQKMKKDQCKN